MMTTTKNRWYIGTGVVTLLSVMLAVAGCGGSSTPPVDNGGGSNNGDGGLQSDALGYNGTVSGKVADSQSTRGSSGTASGQDTPPEFDTAETTVSFLDLDGNELTDDAGEVIEPVTVDSEGEFVAEGLPVGVDFIVCADVDGDGVCDVETTVNVPSNDGAVEGTGEVEDVQIDPLTTLILAKLAEFAAASGLNLAELPVSPNSIVARVVAAYTNLFEESGIDQEVTLDDVAALSADQLAQLFDSLMPAGAKTGMSIVEGNLRGANAEDVGAIAVAAATVFVQAGFPIVDMPGGPDMSSLASLEGVRTTTVAEFQAEFAPPQNIRPPSDGSVTPAQTEPPLAGPPSPDQQVLYISTITEPNRNFISVEGEDGQGGGGRSPFINDFILVNMAQFQFEGRTISLGALHDVLTSLEEGLGLRMVFEVHDPNFAGPPLTVFQTADGAGLALSLQDLMISFAQQGFDQATPEQLQQRDAEVRALLVEKLGSTTPPAFETLFETAIMEPIPPVDQVAQRVRDALAHLPFSRSGPSEFFVVANGDPFRGATSVAPITVNAITDADGVVTTTEYVADGTGKYFLGFTERTEQEGLVQPILRETGRPAHSSSGPVRVSLFDTTLFPDVNGAPFAQLVSEEGNFYPGMNLSVVSSEFVPAPPPPDGTVAAAEEGATGPTQQLFVLATAIGEGASPIHVDYDFTTGVASFNEFGRNVLMFLPDSQQTGQFALFNESTGRPASNSDPSDFFTAPPPPPENFEDSFNTNDGTLPPPPDDGTTLPPPPGDGTTLPPPPDDGTMLPPPPDDTVPPAQVVDGGTTTEPAPAPSTDGFILISAESIVNLPVRAQSFKHVFGTNAANARYDAGGDPYYDDANGNGVHDDGEVTSPQRPTLFNPDDWRSTDVRLYYRRADNGASITFEDIQFDSPTAMTTDGVELVARNFLARPNAFRFGRPNTAINLLTAFAPPSWFDGNHSLNADTQVDVLSAIAIINMVMDQVFNIIADVDIDGAGPASKQTMLLDAHMFTAPIGDPFVLLVKGFERNSAAPNPPPTESLEVTPTTDATATTDATTTPAVE